jgi:hypothetical protein
VLLLAGQQQQRSVTVAHRRIDNKEKGHETTSPLFTTCNAYLVYYNNSIFLND